MFHFPCTCCAATDPLNGAPSAHKFCFKLQFSTSVDESVKGQLCKPPSLRRLVLACCIPCCTALHWYAFQLI